MYVSINILILIYKYSDNSGNHKVIRMNYVHSSRSSSTSSSILVLVAYSIFTTVRHITLHYYSIGVRCALVYDTLIFQKYHREYHNNIR